MRKSNFSLHLSIDLNFRHTSKQIKGGYLKRFWREKMFSPKSMSNLGRLTEYVYLSVFHQTILQLLTMHGKRWYQCPVMTIFYYLLISKIILGHFLTGESQDVPDPPPSRRLAAKRGEGRPPRGPSKGPRNIKQSSRVECNQCNKTFAHASYLTAHRAIHLGK
jgi:hypothetical protein